MRNPTADDKLNQRLRANSDRHVEGTTACDALVRIEEFLTVGGFIKRTVLAIGPNQRPLHVECLRRGASRFVGIEHSADQAESCGPADIVICFDADLECASFCGLLGRVSAEFCYVETGSKMSSCELADRMRAAGFETVTPLPRCRADRRQDRRTYLLDKKVLLRERLEQRRYRGYRLGERFLKGLVSPAIWDRFSHRYLTPNSRYDHRTFRLGERYVRDFRSLELWNKVRHLYARIAHSPYLQECDFSIPGRLTSPLYSGCLAEIELTDEDKGRIRPQVVELVRQLNQAGVAHRDLHSGNIFFHDGRIRLVDLEFLEEDPRPLSECYDLTGQGLECPLKSGRMNVFKDFALSLKNVIGLTPGDFAGSETGSGADRSLKNAA